MNFQINQIALKLPCFTSFFIIILLIICSCFDKTAFSQDLAIDSSVNTSTYDGFDLHRDPATEIEIRYPRNWTLEQNSLTHLNDSILVRPSYVEPIWGKEGDILQYLKDEYEGVIHTTSVTNMLDTIPFIIPYYKDFNITDISEINTSDIIPCVMWYSEHSNITDISEINTPDIIPCVISYYETLMDHPFFPFNIPSDTILYYCIGEYYEHSSITDISEINTSDIIPCLSQYIELPFIVRYHKDPSITGNSANNITNPDLIFSSPLENSTDGFLENIKILPIDTHTDLTLSNLVYYIQFYEDKSCSEVYPSDNLARDVRKNRGNSSNAEASINNSASTKLLDYTLAFVDLYQACMPSFKLLQSGPVTIDEHLAWKIVYSFHLNSKIDDMEYIVSQYYVLNGDRMYIVSFNTLKDSYTHYLGLIETMISSIKFL
jgi:hypothetical protein